METENNREQEGFPTLPETEKWKDTDIKIVYGSKMEFEEKSMRDTSENGEEPNENLHLAIIKNILLQF